MWLDKMIQPQGDPWLLRWDLATTNFMDRDLPPAYLYYNPGRATSALPSKPHQGLATFTISPMTGCCLPTEGRLS
jgi:hypothetical protein